MCNGQLLSISQNTALFSLLGTQYGGDGRVTFALPNLQGMAPMHAGQGPGLTDHTQGEVGGTQTVTLLTTQVPQHNHTYTAGSGSRGNVNTVPGNVNSDSAVSDQYLRRHHRRHADEPQHAPAPAGQPAARKHAAVPGAEFHHRDGRDLSGPQLSFEGGEPLAALVSRFTDACPFQDLSNPVLHASRSGDRATDLRIDPGELCRTHDVSPNRCFSPAHRSVRSSTPTVTAPLARPTFASATSFCTSSPTRWPGMLSRPSSISPRPARTTPPCRCGRSPCCSRISVKPTRTCGNFGTA